MTIAKSVNYKAQEKDFTYIGSERTLMSLFRYDASIRREGYSLLAGVDESGRGPLAGPVVAAAVILPPGKGIRGLRDSKKVSPEKREEIYHKITEIALDFSVGIIDVDIIDRVNILNATHLAIRKALRHLAIKPDLVLVDGLPVPEIPFPQRSIISGDSLSASIASASILAKVIRDKIMDIENFIFPDYGFTSHRGYGTKEHMKSISMYGPSIIHRKTFTPVNLARKFGRDFKLLKRNSFNKSKISDSGSGAFRKIEE